MILTELGVQMNALEFELQPLLFNSGKIIFLNRSYCSLHDRKIKRNFYN